MLMLKSGNKLQTVEACLDFPYPLCHPGLAKQSGVGVAFRLNSEIGVRVVSRCDILLRETEFELLHFSRPSTI